MVAVLITMGVSGCGKTTVGEAMAKELQRLFIDADDLHSPANVNKMRNGIPLNDEDRQDWLNAIVSEANIMINRGEKAVIACSALKRRYRDRLRHGIASLNFIYLKASYAKVYRQLKARRGHFMPLDLLKSQFEALEEPGKAEADVMTIEVQRSLEDTVYFTLRCMQNQNNS